MAASGRAIQRPDRPSSSSSSAANGSTVSSAAVSRSNVGLSGGGQTQQHSARSKLPPSVSNSRRSVTPTSRTRAATGDNDSESERVRVAVRLRPRNDEDLSDTDYPDCVELHPELKRLNLRKNNWNSEAYRFDEVFTSSVSQKRVYEVVAKPVVESVMEGYNGTVMAYGQTGTGKTYTLARLGKDDASERGIMVRAMEDIIAGTSASDCVEISYLQLYMESIRDLLSPEKSNIPIIEDPKTGEVSAPGVEIVEIQSLDHFLQLLQIGESNRHAANTKMNSESSRSHAILMVYIRRSAEIKEVIDIHRQKDTHANGHEHVMRTIRKSKLLLVDLAGSERLEKSGSEGHMLEEAKSINLSLTSLGKCINALAENSPHIPTRDSKLTRLLRDSFGGSARTSLIITIGPSSRHHAETASTIMFGQRAMKVVNMVKLKEEFDYESLCRKLEIEVDHLTSEVDRQQKWRENYQNDMEKKLEDLRNSSNEMEKHLVARSEVLQKENDHLTANMKGLLQDLNSQGNREKLLLNDIAQLETAVKNSKFLENENARLTLELNDVLVDLKNLKSQNNTMHHEVVSLETCLKQSKQQQLENSTYQKALADITQMYENKISDLMEQLEDENAQRVSYEQEIEKMQKRTNEIQISMQQNLVKSSKYHKALGDTTSMYEEKIEVLNQQLENELARAEGISEELSSTKKLLSHYHNSQVSTEQEINELQMRLKETNHLSESAADELQILKLNYRELESEKNTLRNELHATKQMLQVEERQRKQAESELLSMKKVPPETEDVFEEKKPYIHDSPTKGTSASLNPQISHKSSRSREMILSQRNTITKICEEVGLQKILSLLESEDIEVQIHAVKVVANLAAEDVNQERIVQEGGLDALLKLVDSSRNPTILRVASGAIANLAMNEINQGLITSKGGAQLLANVPSKTDDPQTSRMVAGAIANLCGNEKLHEVLKEDGATKALLQMGRSGNAEVVAQVARGLANFSKCESRRIIQGHWRGRSFLMEDGALSWLAEMLNTASTSTRRHVELAICHLAQNEDNAADFIASGCLKELIEISEESNRDDIRSLAKKTLRLSTVFRGEVRFM